MRFSSALKHGRTFWKQPRGQRVLLLEAALWLAVARLAIVVLPFPRIARYLGTLHKPGSEAEECATEPRIAREIAWAVNRAAWVSPYRLVCLPRALAGWQMLHRRGVRGRLHFGASRDPETKNLRTHAWLDGSGVEVTGYPEAHDCVEVGYYAR